MNGTAKTQIRHLSAMEIAAAIRKKEISCEETMISHLEQVESINKKINAVSVTLHDSALDAARKADRLIASGESLPPLLGVPVTVKENIDCAGSATTFSVKVLKDARPQTDAPHIKNLNVLGLPAAALPVGTANKLPQGVQLIGPKYHERLCLEAAQAIEDRLGTITPLGL